MKLQIKKSCLRDVLKRAKEVATKGIKADFEFSNRVRIETQANKIVVTTTNGNLDFKFAIPESSSNLLKIESTGECVAWANSLYEVVNTIGGIRNPDLLIEIAIEGDRLYIRNTETETKTKTKRKEVAKLATIQSSFKSIDFSAPKNPVTSHEFDSEMFLRGVRAVSKYVSIRGYKVRYQMLCLHLLNDMAGTGRARFVCGDGARFGIYSQKVDKPFATEEKHVIPVEQLNIMSTILSDSSKISMQWKDKQTCYITSNDGMELLMKGIPEIDYIAYENHAYRTEDAKLIVDLPVSSLIDSMDAANAAQSKESTSDSEKQFRTVYMSISTNGEVNFKVEEKAFAWGAIDDATVYKVAGDDDNFSSMYAIKFLDESIRSTKYDTLRFYCINSDGVMIVHPGNVNENDRDSKDVPKMFNGEENEFAIFFASVKENQAE